MASLYDLIYLLSGLLYLPSGIGGLIASLQTGKLLDYNYKVVARGLEVSPSTSCNSTDIVVPVPSRPASVSMSHQNLCAFPIERARLQSIVAFFLVSSLSTLGYGWSLHFKTPIAVPLVTQFLSSSTQVGIFVILGTLLTDLSPGRSSTAQAAYSVVRCGLAAGGVAALSPVVQSVGVAWCLTVMMGLSLPCARGKRCRNSLH